MINFGTSTGSAPSLTTVLSNLTYNSQCQDCRDSWLAMSGNRSIGGQDLKGASDMIQNGVSMALAGQNPSSAFVQSGLTQSAGGGMATSPFASSVSNTLQSAMSSGSQYFSDPKTMQGVVGGMLGAGIEEAVRAAEEQKKREEEAARLARNGGPIGRAEAKALAQGSPGVADAVEREERLNLASQKEPNVGESVSSGSKVTLSGFASSYMGVIEQVRDGSGKFAGLDNEGKLEKIRGYRDVALEKLERDPSFSEEQRHEFTRRADMCMRQVKHQA
ncbi:MAG: hypothetical protein PHC51_08115 [bacterium]|nr:hypothetical protein [bacterium]